MEGLSDDTGDYWVDYQIPVIENCTPIEFSRDAFARYHPVILKGGVVDDWPALKWNRESLINKLGEKSIPVNVTLNGRADSIQTMEYNGNQGDFFIYPAEVSMTMDNFFQLLTMDRSENSVIPYLSQQNDNLRSNFPELLEDIQVHIPLAEAVFPNTSNGPEAINLWIGDERSVSSIHKDYFENFYLVIEGEKTFTLYPPTDCVFFPEKTVPTLQYQVTNTSTYDHHHPNIPKYELTTTHENCPADTISWLAFDPDDLDQTVSEPSIRYLLQQAHPIRCTVKAGEILYIPAMWYHRVSQNCLTIAVNYWYDMRFDFRYVLMNMALRMWKADYDAQQQEMTAALLKDDEEGKEEEGDDISLSEYLRGYVIHEDEDHFVDGMDDDEHQQSLPPPPPPPENSSKEANEIEQ